MMGQHFRLRSELSRAIAKSLQYTKNQLSAPCSFFNQFVADIYVMGKLQIWWNFKFP